MPVTDKQRPRPLPTRPRTQPYDGKNFVTDGSITWAEFYALLVADIRKNRLELRRVGKMLRDEALPKQAKEALLERQDTLEQRIDTAGGTIRKYGGDVP